MKWRSETYLKKVRALPSVISGQYGCDAHHMIGHGVGGMGTKASDEMTFPLTRQEHSELHRIGFKRWESKYGRQLTYVLRTQRKLCEVLPKFEEGVA